MSHVITEIRNGVGHLQLNRGSALNALSRDFCREIDDAVVQFDKADDVRVILICSAARHFCAGADIAEMAGMSAEEARQTGFVGCVERLHQVAKPVIVAVNGLAAGGGCELVEMCDIVIAGERAQFGHPEITLAAMPGAGGTQRLTRVVGKHLAMDVLLTGRFLSATEALGAGLVSRVVPDADLHRIATEIAEKVASFSAPVARRIKASIRSTQVGLDDGLAREMHDFHQCFAEANFAEGLSAFLGKRKPEFRH